MKIKVDTSKQTPALDSAMFGAVAAGRAVGGYDSIFNAAQQMAQLKREASKPISADQKVYDQLCTEYVCMTISGEVRMT